ncbi:DUF6711 family protein [Paenibacillus sp. sgz302251]|uniref:DUF6711 family protein n=1 Tax=Paenibacillus sp. sgz302251 TaxID=3414493 RepID=UPI003C7B24E3
MALLQINGVDMPAPSSLSIGAQDIGKWERNASGSMIGEIIATKAKIELEWKYLTPAQLAQILSAIDSTFFNVTYTDPKTNSLRTMSCYKGDRNMGIMDFIGGVLRYKDLKVNFIEK